MNVLKVKDIIKLPIEYICVNPENPRHDVVMDLGESFIMQQLVKTRKDTQAMYKLICDIYDAGWFPQSIVTVTYDDKKGKYIAWDGNRRLTALKIMKNPELIKNFKYFTYTQISHIKTMNKEIKDDTFYEVSCYVAESFEECAGYIRTIHTTDTGALPWTDVAKKRFENKLGIKNMFSQLKEYCSKPFENISENFSVNKFERIATSKIGKEYFGIDNIGNTLIPKTAVNELEKKLTRVVKDIDTGVLKNKNIKNSNEMKKYLYGGEADEVIVNSEAKTIPINSENTKVIDKKQNNNFVKDEDYEQLSIIKPSSYELIKKETRSIFVQINIKNLKLENPRTIGIKDLCYEIQQMCLSMQDKKYCIAFAFLIRSLLEQSSIYFLINKDRWNKLKEGHAGKDLKLEQIIKELEKNKSRYFDENTLRCWETLNNTATKSYFDMIVHHPYLIRANKDTINNISDSGLFAIIQFFLNN